MKCCDRINVIEGGSLVNILKYSEQNTIPLYLCDRHRELPLTMMIQIMLGVSGSQTNKFEDDLVNNYMKENDLSWIILQYELNIKRLPKAGETINIETYAAGYNRLFCYRYFNIYGEDEQKISDALVTFAWINIKKRKMVRLNPKIMSIYGAPKEDKIRRHTQPKRPDNDKAKTTHFDIHYSDIDSNNHVNNTVYVDWAIASLGIDFVNTYQPTYLKIKFDKEVLEDQDVQVVSSTTESENKASSKHLVITESNENALLELEWKKRR